MNMTLEQVRDWHRFQWSLNEARGTPWDGKEHEEMADAIESAQAELTELRAIVARLREPVSDELIEKCWLAYFNYEGPDEYTAMRAALTAHNKRILGEAE